MDASDEEVKEVYARFGLAYYHSEVLHRGLCNLYAFSQASEGVPMTWPRFEEHLQKGHSATFGQIVKLAAAFVPNELLAQFNTATDQRNFVAHHFWFDRIHLLATSSGCEQACDELAAY